MLVGINAVDLYYDRQRRIISYIYNNIYPRVCILPEKGDEIYVDMRGIILNAPKCKCDYKKFVNDDGCRNCVCYDKHESSLGVCCIGKGIDAVLMVECDCDDFKEGVKHECLNNFECKDIVDCWVQCTGSKH